MKSLFLILTALAVTACSSEPPERVVCTGNGSEALIKSESKYSTEAWEITDHPVCFGKQEGYIVYADQQPTPPPVGQEIWLSGGRAWRFNGEDWDELKSYDEFKVDGITEDKPIEWELETTYGLYSDHNFAFKDDDGWYMLAKFEDVEYKVRLERVQ